ncbi:hypothetical protein GQ43DRAFT_173318 [Delitschia confertaspora ATCC 74209]|uniref:Uncharacterized protein n=1 Tax=Delitschia confertaspora ATCC 74209 TaxID=1513339 RepID=A0A9P4N232_9PLEO|nr:hypothetical protein GQ43DRAFT_173318 [Delitschia confertaspora ATCC 74209]
MIRRGSGGLGTRCWHCAQGKDKSSSQPSSETLRAKRTFVTCTLSLALCHLHSVTCTLSLALCHLHSIHTHSVHTHSVHTHFVTRTLSLALCRSNLISLALGSLALGSLALGLSQFVTRSLSLALCHFHFVTCMKLPCRSREFIPPDDNRPLSGVASFSFRIPSLFPSEKWSISSPLSTVPGL